MAEQVGCLGPTPAQAHLHLQPRWTKMPALRGLQPTLIAQPGARSVTGAPCLDRDGEMITGAPLAGRPAFRWPKARRRTSLPNGDVDHAGRQLRQSLSVCTKTAPWKCTPPPPGSRASASLAAVPSAAPTAMRMVPCGACCPYIPTYLACDVECRPFSGLCCPSMVHHSPPHQAGPPLRPFPLPHGRARGRQIRSAALLSRCNAQTRSTSSVRARGSRTWTLALSCTNRYLREYLVLRT